MPFSGSFRFHPLVFSHLLCAKLRANISRELEAVWHIWRWRVTAIHDQHSEINPAGKEEHENFMENNSIKDGRMNPVEAMLQAIRADLEANQIDLHIHDDVLDMLYQYYTGLVSTESQEDRQAHLACMDAILRIVRERDEARGMVQLQEPDCGHPQEGRPQAD